MSRRVLIAVALIFGSISVFSQNYKNINDFFSLQLKMKSVYEYYGRLQDSLNNHYKKTDKSDSARIKELEAVVTKYGEKYRAEKNELLANLNGMDFPDFYFNDFEDKSWSISDFKNVKIILNFNYAFCNSCVNFVDSLVKYKKGDQKIIVLFHDKKEDVLALYEKHKNSVLIGFIREENEQFYTLFCSTPSTFLIDDNRKIKFFDRNSLIENNEKELFKKIQDF